MAVEERLEVVVAVIGDLCRVEDRVYIWHGLRKARACLVIDDSDALLAVGWVGDAVETVDDAAYDRLAPRHVGRLFQAQNGEGCQAAVCLDEEPQVSYDDLTVD